MRIATLLAPVLALVFALQGCNSTTNNSHLPNSTGRAYEMIVVCSKAMWSAPLGDTLRSVLLEPVPMLNQREPHFDLIQMVPEGFTNIIQRHRNVLIVQVNAGFTVTAMEAAYDIYATPQLIVELSAPSDSAAMAYLDEYGKELIEIFSMAERDRFVAFATRKGEATLQKLIEEQFDVEIAVPKGYTLRQSSEDFLWLSYELPLVSQGISIYSYPYEGSQQMTLDSLLLRRGEFVSRIPGPSEGSYMSTSDAVDPLLSYQRINGRNWAVMRGFWDVEGDFMGGPFVSYTTVDATSGRVITIDSYVFSPKHRKRNYVRELENLIYTVKFE